MMEILKEKEEIIAELEKSINRLKEEQVDHSRLLETMQSDKIAASRAVTQNRELKKQLEELQNGFVSMVSCVSFISMTNRPFSSNFLEFILILKD